VHRRNLLAGPAASRGGGGVGDEYETELLEPLAAADDAATAGAAREFFARLDAQLNKVNQFYRGKEEEFLERGRSLRKQMDILAGLKATAGREDTTTNNHSADSSVASGGCSSGEHRSITFLVNMLAPISRPATI
jgi:hypothetical protein